MFSFAHQSLTVITTCINRSSFSLQLPSYRSYHERPYRNPAQQEDGASAVSFLPRSIFVQSYPSTLQTFTRALFPPPRPILQLLFFACSYQALSTSIAIMANLSSRTPQNTPAANAPINSRAQAPNLGSLSEGKNVFQLEELKRRY